MLGISWRLFRNARGWDREFWFHELRARQWLVVERNTATNHIANRDLARLVLLASAGVMP